MNNEDARELADQQRRRERTERELARGSEEPEETATHERRADKAAYLRSKLKERARSEDE